MRKSELTRDITRLLWEGKTYKVLTNVGKIDEKNGFPRGTVYLFISSADIENRTDTTQELESALFSINGVDNVRVYYLENVKIDELTLNNWENKVDKENIVELIDASGRQMKNTRPLLMAK